MGTPRGPPKETPPDVSFRKAEAGGSVGTEGERRRLPLGETVPGPPSPRSGAGSTRGPPLSVGCGSGKASRGPVTSPRTSPPRAPALRPPEHQERTTSRPELQRPFGTGPRGGGGPPPPRGPGIVPWPGHPSSVRIKISPQGMYDGPSSECHPKVGCDEGSRSRSRLQGRGESGAERPRGDRAARPPTRSCAGVRRHGPFPGLGPSFPPVSAPAGPGRRPGFGRRPLFNAGYGGMIHSAAGGHPQPDPSHPPARREATRPRETPDPPCHGTSYWPFGSEPPPWRQDGPQSADPRGTRTRDDHTSLCVGRTPLCSRGIPWRTGLD